MLKELATYIAANTSLTLDSTLFAGERPQSAADACVVLLDRGGEQVWDIADARIWNIQALVRNVSHFTARAVAMEIHGLLVGRGNSGLTLTAVGSGPVYFLNVVHGDLPQRINGRDEKRRVEFSANYRIRAREEE